MAQAPHLHVDILRGRNYPQTDDDPCACSTLVRLLVYNDTLKEVLTDVFTTQLQENSNAPFYSASTDFEIPSSVESVVLVVEVVETTRRMEPYVMFYGAHTVRIAARGKHEEVIVLTPINPVEDAEAAAARAAQQEADSATPCPQLSIRYQLQRPGNVEEEVVDVHADVPLAAHPNLNGSCCIIPKDSQYVWVNLISDARWKEAFRAALVHEWRDRAPLQLDAATAASSPGDAQKGGTGARSNARAGPSAVTDVRTVGDVILKRWCCCRSHEVLTRLRLCAEAFSRGERSLHFTRESELAFRLKRKERTVMLQDLTQAALTSMGHSVLSDVVYQLWILFSTGINHDPAGTRVLTYEVRKRVKENTFDDFDKAVLQSNMLNFLIPSLSLEHCNELVTEDMNSVPTEAAEEANSGAQETTGGPASKPTAEVFFAMSLLEIVGAMLDTLTDTELVAALKMFAPSVGSAYQRLQNGAKDEMKQLHSKGRSQRQLKPYNPGEGIKIDHLDILGRRKKSVHLRSA
ncbi:hypothetical protein DQ04_08441000 [Trypanosoma grayi]|uniref:hypothetical protein n=1 Tax=Trypanosoma grayi TaxID=71804 RepID=UPI0004F3FE74|nr:hypothetical protein DQ04_08441000 [Trypanosoma grayi]KEG07930.1 hypothetical protein DQ04_08441000 [Trypanosoma grayi]